MPELSERFAAINLAQPRPDIVYTVTDGGEFINDLASYGLTGVITTKRSFSTGEVGEPGPDGSLRPLTIDPGDIVVVRNHVIPPSKGGYLRDLRVLNSDDLKDYVDDVVNVEEDLGRWGASQAQSDAEPRLPDGLGPVGEDGVGEEALRMYVVKDGNVSTIVPVLRYKDASGVHFADISLPDNLSDQATEIARIVSDRIARGAGVRHLVGAFTMATTNGSDLVIVRSHFKNPEFPVTTEAPRAARRLFGATARALANMASERE